MDIPFQFLTENEFSPAPAANGTINSQPGYGTFASQNVTQTPSSFHSATNNKSLGSTSDSTNGTEQSGSLQKDLNAIYSKKQVPSADEIVCGIKAEMAKQLTKNKAEAKAEVIKNLKKDPKYYSSLKHLGIDDETMMNEITQKDINSTHPKNPAIFDKLKGWDISKLTLDNLNALRDKMNRFIRAAKLKGNEDYAYISSLESERSRYDAEIQKRLDYINKPIMENKKQTQKEATKKIFDDLMVEKNNKYVVNSGIVEAMRQTREAKERRSQWKQGRID